MELEAGAEVPRKELSEKRPRISADPELSRRALRFFLGCLYSLGVRIRSAWMDSYTLSDDHDSVPLQNGHNEQQALLVFG